MVSDQEEFRSDNNRNYTDKDKVDINDTTYDNMKLTRISMSSSSSSSSSSTSTTLKSAESDHDAETPEKLSTCYRSMTTTPTRSGAVTHESIMNAVIIGCDSGHISAGTLTRPSRAYRIIDSNVSQKILQQLVADKLAAAQTIEKGAKFLKRKGSNKGTSNFFFQRQASNFGSQIWNRTEELSLISKAPIFRTHFDVVRTSSFSRDQTQTIRKHLDYNRNSLPISIISLNKELVSF